MDEGRAPLVHHLRLLLRIEILRNQADDAHELALPIFEPRGSFFNQIQQVLFRKPELPLDFLEPRLLVAVILLVFSGAGYGAPQIVVCRFEMRAPLLRPAPLLGEIWLGAVRVAVDAVILLARPGDGDTLVRL